MTTTRRKRDMSEREFRRALERNGFADFSIGPLGYVRLPGTKVSVSVRNARSMKLRDILAYLIHEKRKHSEP